jgi:hypothetical protein
VPDPRDQRLRRGAQRVHVLGLGVVELRHQPVGERRRGAIELHAQVGDLQPQRGEIEAARDQQVEEHQVRPGQDQAGGLHDALRVAVRLARHRVVLRRLVERFELGLQRVEVVQRIVGQQRRLRAQRRQRLRNSVDESGDDAFAGGVSGIAHVHGCPPASKLRLAVCQRQERSE